MPFYAPLNKAYVDIVPSVHYHETWAPCGAEKSFFGDLIVWEAVDIRKIKNNAESNALDC